MELAQYRIWRGLGGKNAGHNYTGWDEVSVKSCEHETDSEQYGNQVYRYLAGDPVRVRGGNAKYRKYIVQLAKHTFASANGERHVDTGNKV